MPPGARSLIRAAGAPPWVVIGRAPAERRWRTCRGRRRQDHQLKRDLGEAVYLGDICGGGEADDVIGASSLEACEVLPDGIRVLGGARHDLLGAIAEEGVVAAERIACHLFGVLAEREVKQ